MQKKAKSKKVNNKVTAEHDDLLYDVLGKDLKDESNDDNKSTRKKLKPFQIRISPTDLRLRSYSDDWGSEELAKPNFQREYVWDKKKASRFIESILLGLPVPNVFLYESENEAKNLIIDGHQRIVTIASFVDGKFLLGKLKGKEFAIDTGIKGGLWEGKTYENLKEKERFKFENFVMRAIIVEQMSPDGEEGIYQIFERLNTGGMTLNPMEVRMSIGVGKFTELLKKLNIDKSWGKLLGRANPETPDIRARDMELILRFFALHDLGEKYKSPMKDALTKYVIDNQCKGENEKKENEWLEEKKNLFLGTVKKALQLGDKPFHIHGESQTKIRRFNVSVFDSIMVNLANSDLDIKELKPIYEIFINNQEYLKLVQKGRSTTDTKVIQERMNFVETKFKEKVN